MLGWNSGFGVTCVSEEGGGLGRSAKVAVSVCETGVIVDSSMPGFVFSFDETSKERSGLDVGMKLGLKVVVSEGP